LVVKFKGDLEISAEVHLGLPR